MRRTLLSLLLCGFAILSAAQSINLVRINEVMSANIDQFVDPSWNYGGWIEVYNPTGKDFNLQGCWISDNPEQRKKIHVSQPTPLPSHGFACLWFDHHDRCCPSQMNMKLDVEGGVIILSNPSGMEIGRVEYPAAMPRNSWARREDGKGEFAWTSMPTPGASNVGADFGTERLPAPETSRESGIFDSSFTLQVKIPEGATLRYTIDGSTPTRTHGATSTTGTFLVSHNHVFRFVLYQKGWLTSPVVTRTYIRKDKDFELPILSVVTNPDNLYSSKLGVFVVGENGRRGKGASTPCNWNMDWDRPINFEYITPEGKEMLNVEADLSRCGGHSKGSSPFSFKVKASKQYEGRNSLDCQFFPDKPYLKYKGLQIRGGSNDCYCRVWDPFLQSLVRTSGIDMDLQDYEPVCHYINGVYKGLINMRETNNKHNVYANYGLDDEEIDMFEIECDSCYVQMCGTDVAWKQLKALCAESPSEDNYLKLRNMVDIDELCNYVAVQMYLGNNDWPQNNQKAWRPRVENGKFRFVLYDLDAAFTSSNHLTTFESRQWFTFCQLFDVPGYSNFTREVELVPIFLGLMKYDAFRKQFVDAFCLVAGSVFDPTRCETLIRQWAARVYPMQLLDDGGYGRNRTPWTTAMNLIENLSEDWQEKMYKQIKSYNRAKLNGIQGQRVRLSANVPQATLQCNGQVLTTGHFLGTFFPPMTFRASAPQGYRFLGWMLDGKWVSKEENLEMPEGEGLLDLQACYEEEKTHMMVNEVSAGNSVFVNEYFKKNDWVELYNPTSHEVDVEGMYLSDNPEKPFKYRISSEGTAATTLVPANGYSIVWCDKLETESQLHAPFKLDNANGSCVVLTAADESWSDTLYYCAHEGGESVGRFPDGGKEVYRMYNPTIAQRNAMDSYTSRLEPQEWQNEAKGYTDIAIAHMGNLGISYGNQMLIVRHAPVEALLTVYDVSGQKVMEQRLSPEEEKSYISTNLLRPGTYVAHVVDAEGNKCVLKFF